MKSRAQFHSAAKLKQIFLLSNIKQTTGQNAYILYESLAGKQRNMLSKLLYGKQFYLLSSSMKLGPELSHDFSSNRIAMLKD